MPDLRRVRDGYREAQWEVKRRSKGLKSYEQGSALIDRFCWTINQAALWEARTETFHNRHRSGQSTMGTS